jgi:hypothetical protein
MLIGHLDIKRFFLIEMEIYPSHQMQGALETVYPWGSFQVL